MTNDAVAIGLQLADTNMSLTNGLVIRDPASIPAMAWLISIVFMPLISAICYFRARTAQQKGTRVGWQARAILLAALLAITTTLMATSTTIHDVFYYRMTQEWGAAQDAMLRINIAHACGVFRVGVLITSICLTFAIVCPRSKE